MSDPQYAEGGEIKQRAMGGPLPRDMPRMRSVRVGVGMDGMCIYEWVPDEDGDDTN
jgi:hypothetical protein